MSEELEKLNGEYKKIFQKLLIMDSDLALELSNVYWAATHEAYKSGMQEGKAIWSS